MIQYEEVECKEIQYDEGMTHESSEEKIVGTKTTPANPIVLRKHEYRTARHMALMETQISRRTRPSGFPDQLT